MKNKNNSSVNDIDSISIANYLESIGINYDKQDGFIRNYGAQIINGHKINPFSVNLKTNLWTDTTSNKTEHASSFFELIRDYSVNKEDYYDDIRWRILKMLLMHLD